MPQDQNDDLLKFPKNHWIFILIAEMTRQNVNVKALVFSFSFLLLGRCVFKNHDLECGAVSY